MDMNKESDVFGLAIKLLAMSNFNTLDASQSWALESYLNPMEVAQYQASNKLFEAYEILKQARLRAESDAAIRRGIKLLSIPIPE